MDGRKKIKLIPAGVLGLTTKDEVLIYQEVFGLSEEQAQTHRELRKLGRIYITENARGGCNYQVLVRQGPGVPNQLSLGVTLVQILVRRIDGEEEPIPWRDLQEIKDVVMGPDREALELYPSKFRRLRELKFRVLWGVLSDEPINIGWPDEG